LGLTAASTTSAQPSLVRAVTTLRAGGCAGNPGIAAPLRARDTLDRAARRIADGATLESALANVGYAATTAVVVQISGDGNDTAIARALEERACRNLLDPAVTEMGTARSPGASWIVLAAPFPPEALRDEAAVLRRLLVLANEARAESRRCGNVLFGAAAPLTTSPALTQAARTHAADLARRDVTTHEGRDGSGPADRISRAGYRWRRVAENVASGILDGDEAMRGWIASPGHCANLMTPDFTETGIAFVTAPATSGRVYWVQVFAVPQP